MYSALLCTCLFMCMCIFIYLQTCMHCSYDPWLQHTRKPWTCWSNKFVEEYIHHNSYIGILCYLTNIGTSCQRAYCMNLAPLLVPLTCMRVRSHTVQRDCKVSLYHHSQLGFSWSITCFPMIHMLNTFPTKGNFV